MNSQRKTNHPWRAGNRIRPKFNYFIAKNKRKEKWRLWNWSWLDFSDHSIDRTSRSLRTHPPHNQINEKSLMASIRWVNIYEIALGDDQTFFSGIISFWVGTFYVNLHSHWAVTAKGKQRQRWCARLWYRNNNLPNQSLLAISGGKMRCSSETFFSRSCSTATVASSIFFFNLSSRRFSPSYFVKVGTIRMNHWSNHFDSRSKHNQNGLQRRLTWYYVM